MTLRNAILIPVLLASIGCGGSGSPAGPPSPTPSPTPAPTPSSAFSATIDGSAWSATTAMAQRSGPAIAIGSQGGAAGSQAGDTTLNILLSNPQVGTQRIVQTAATAAVPVFAQMGRWVGGVPASQWNAGDRSNDEGFVTVTALSSTRIVGTFEIDFHLYTGAPPQTRQVRNGRFDLAIQ